MSRDHDFYCYNSFDAVHAAATYWLIQKSQTWKILKARLLLTRLDLEVFDYVTLGFIAPYVSTDNAVGLITRCVYDSDEKYIDVEIWCPVLLGTMTTSDFGFPASATEVDEWPQFHTEAGGGGRPVEPPAPALEPSVRAGRGYRRQLRGRRPEQPGRLRQLPIGGSASRRPSPMQCHEPTCSPQPRCRSRTPPRTTASRLRPTRPCRR